MEQTAEKVLHPICWHRFRKTLKQKVEQITKVFLYHFPLSGTNITGSWISVDNIIYRIYVTLKMEYCYNKTWENRVKYLNYHLSALLHMFDSIFLTILLFTTIQKCPFIFLPDNTKIYAFCVFRQEKEWTLLNSTVK